MTASSGARPRSCNRTVARPRPRDDRPVEHARHRERQAVRSGRGDEDGAHTPAFRRRMRYWAAQVRCGLAAFLRRHALDLSRAARISSRTHRPGLRRSRHVSDRLARRLPITTPISAIKRLGDGQFYLINIKDKDGRELRRGEDLPPSRAADVPIEQYWSLTAYDRETHALIKNVDRASRASNATDVKKNADGSVDLYLRHRGARRDRNQIGFRPTRSGNSSSCSVFTADQRILRRNGCCLMWRRYHPAFQEWDRFPSGIVEAKR